jgi:preprotein translocase subunit YajC
MAVLIIIVVLLALAWLFLVLPTRRRQRSHAAMQDEIEAGDEIITAGGIHGVVREAAEKELRVEIADGVVVRLDRRAVAAVAEEVPADADADAAKGAAAEDLSAAGLAPAAGEVSPPESVPAAEDAGAGNEVSAGETEREPR